MTLKPSLLISLFFLSSLPFSAYSNSSSSQNYKHPNIEKSVFQISSDQNIATAFYIGNNRFAITAHTLLSEDDMEFLALLYSNLSNENKITEQNKQKIIKSFNEDNYRSAIDLSNSFEKTLSVQYNNQPISLKKIVAINFEYDLIILEASKEYSELIKELIPLEMSSLSPSSLQDLKDKKGYIYGFPSDNPEPYGLYEFKEMTFEHLEFYDDHSFINVYANTTHMSGGSGSPLLIDGKVIGMVKSSFENEVVAITSNIITEIMNKETVSLTKYDEVVSLFLSFLQKTKADSNKSWISLKFLESVEPPQEKELIYERTQELENLLDQNQNQNLSQARWLLIHYYFQLKEFEKAFETAKGSSDPHALFLVGILNLENGQLDEGIISLKKSAEGGFASSLFAIAIYYLVTNDTDLYEEYMKKAADKGHALAKMHLLNSTYFYDGKENTTLFFDFYVVLRNNPNYIVSDYFIGLYKSLLSKQENALQNVGS